MSRPEPKKPWPFQETAIGQIRRKWSQGIKRQVLVSPPGSGKTEMAAHIVRRFKNPACFVHTKALQENAEKRLCTTYVLQSVLDGGVDLRQHDGFIWDECHHSAGERWGTLFDVLPKVKGRVPLVLGLTGTPQRGDGKPLDRFEDLVVAANYSELLANGFIVPFQVVTPARYYDHQEPDPAKAWLRYGEDMKSVIFCKSVEQADDVAKRLGKKRAAPWHGEVPWGQRQNAFELFEKNRLRVLVTVDALTEGVNVPDVQCVVMAKRCLAASTFLQGTARAGRASRGKPFAKLLDLTGCTNRHGMPTEDRIYTLDGSGIQRRGGGGGRDWYYERQPPDPDAVGSYDAELRITYDPRSPSARDKRRQMGWLREHANRNGWGPEVAQRCYDVLFGKWHADAVEPAE